MTYEPLQQRSDIVSDLFAIHGLSGPDIVATLRGVGTGTVLKVAKKRNVSLDSIGNINASMDTVVAQAMQFICTAYGKVVVVVVGGGGVRQ